MTNALFQNFLTYWDAVRTAVITRYVHDIETEQVNRLCNVALKLSKVSYLTELCTKSVGTNFHLGLR